jgi:hypothetical protein
LLGVFPKSFTILLRTQKRSHPTGTAGALAKLQNTRHDTLKVAVAQKRMGGDVTRLRSRKCPREVAYELFRRRAPQSGKKDVPLHPTLGLFGLT